MTYQSSLQVWAVVRVQPNCANQVLHRFKNRSDAEGHLQLHRRLSPNHTHFVMFIPPEVN